jgi:hypothetical protein
MLRSARRRIDETNVVVELRPAEALPCEEHAFDWVVSTFTLCSIERVGDLLAEVTGCSSPAGASGASGVVFGRCCAAGTCRRMAWSDAGESMPTKTRSDGNGAAIWERVTRFEGDPSPTAARALLKLQFPEGDRLRMRDLAAKARTGELTADEERETDTYERLGCLLDIVHSKARRVLMRRRTNV